MSVSPRSVLHLLVAGAAFSALGASVPLERTAEHPLLARQPRFVEGQVIVQYRPGVTRSLALEQRLPIQLRRLSLLRDGVIGGLLARNPAGDLELALVPENMGVKEAVAALRNHPDVAFAEPNWIVTKAVTPSDPKYTNGSLWGLYGPSTSPSNAYGINAPAAWNLNYVGSRNTVIGVIDEGVQVTHPDLVDNIWRNPGEIAGNGIDDDANGFIDDVNGYDFVNNDATVYDGGTTGSSDTHGTHVSGTIGATGNNGTGVVGVNWQVSIISAKFLGANGGTTADGVRAINYLTDLKLKYGLNLVATNNSWGGGADEASQALKDAIVRAGQNNILFICAAGNDSANNDTTVTIPAEYNTTAELGWNSVIVVASITSTGAKSSFSNYGATKVHLGAPGSSIHSTYPPNTYSTLDGTSMATPHVTGAAALISAATGKVGRDLRDAILSNVKPLSSMSGRTTTGGRLDLSFLAGTATTVTASITTPSTNVTIASGTTQSFVGTATSSGTGATWTYAWTFGDGGTAATASTSHLFTNTGTTNLTRTATFKATDNTGSFATATRTITVTPAPVTPTAPSITSQPASLTVNAPATATFSVTASGTAPFTYQWRKNGTAISGATSASYTTPATATTDSGATFSVVVTNGVGSATSANATLTVNATPAGTFTEVEANNTLATANAVAPAFNAIKGNLTVATDQDNFALTLSAGQKVTLNMTGPTGVDWDLKLKNAAGTALASSAGSSTTESVTYTNSGTTALTVYPNVFVYSGVSATPYNLALTYVTPVPAVTFNEVEPNASIAAANVTPDNTTKIVGHIGSSTDNDYFKLNVGAGKTLKVVMTGPTGSTYDYDLYFYNAAGTQLASGTGATTSETVSWANTGTAITAIHVAVKGYKGSSTTTPYNLAITR